MRRAHTRWAALGVVFALCPVAAFAWPVDRVIWVAPGKVTFGRAPSVAWIESADPSIATAELLPSGELLFTGKREGKTLALSYGLGQVTVWRVEVSAAPHPDATPDLSAAQKACPELKTAEDKVSVTVKGEACRQALAAALRTGGMTSEGLSLTFELGALQAQLSEIAAAISKIDGEVKVHYLGAGLVLQGRVTQAEHREILWAVFRHTLGRVALEDRLVVELPDGGVSSDSMTDDFP